MPQCPVCDNESCDTRNYTNHNQREFELSPRDARLFPKCQTCGKICPVGKRKCINCISTKKYKVTTGRPVRAGANARGIAAHKPDKIRTRRAKRQNPERMNSTPYMTSSHVDPARAIRKPNEEVW